MTGGFNRCLGATKKLKVVEGRGRYEALLYCTALVHIARYRGTRPAQPMMMRPLCTIAARPVFASTGDDKGHASKPDAGKDFDIIYRRPASRRPRCYIDPGAFRAPIKFWE